MVAKFGAQTDYGAYGVQALGTAGKLHPVVVSAVDSHHAFSGSMRQAFGNLGLVSRGAFDADAAVTRSSAIDAPYSGPDSKLLAILREPAQITPSPATQVVAGPANATGGTPGRSRPSTDLKLT